MDGVPTSASLFDFGLYFFHNAHQTLQIGIGPYFYLPKMESHLEARYVRPTRAGAETGARANRTSGSHAVSVSADGRVEL